MPRWPRRQASCHPDRKHYAENKCEPCFIATLHDPPAARPIQGVQRRTIAAVPDRCPRCAAPVAVDERRVSCPVGCGWDAFVLA